MSHSRAADKGSVPCMCTSTQQNRHDVTTASHSGTMAAETGSQYGMKQVLLQTLQAGLIRAGRAAHMHAQHGNHLPTLCGTCSKHQPIGGCASTAQSQTDTARHISVAEIPKIHARHTLQSTVTGNAPTRAHHPLRSRPTAPISPTSHPSLTH
jgi:hypothetical protein